MVVGQEVSERSFWVTRVQPKLDLIAGWARSGLDNTQIARNLGVSITTLKTCLKSYQELEDALMEGREYAEVLVENALFKKAVGYTYKETVKERVKEYEPVFDDEGNLVTHRWSGRYEVVTTKQTAKTQAPDTQAIIYWLEHRAPKRWKKFLDDSDDSPIEIIIRKKVQNALEEQSVLEQENAEG
jgi:hypothetical protein